MIKSQAQFDAESVTQFEREARAAEINTAAYREVCRTYPAITPCEATYNALVAYFQPGVITVEGVTAALQPGASDLLNRLAIRSDAQAREDFATTIAAGSANPEYTKTVLLQKFRVSDHFGDTAIAQTPVFTTAQLQEKAAEQERKREARGMKVHELQSVVRDARTGHALPPLPAEFTQAVLLAKDFPGSKLRVLIRLHGHEAVTARIQGKQ